MFAACDKGSGGSGYADAISKAYAQATATGVCPGFASKHVLVALCQLQVLTLVT